MVTKREFFEGLGRASVFTLDNILVPGAIMTGRAIVAGAELTGKAAVGTKDFYLTYKDNIDTSLAYLGGIGLGASLGGKILNTDPVTGGLAVASSTTGLVVIDKLAGKVADKDHRLVPLVYAGGAMAYFTGIQALFGINQGSDVVDFLRDTWYVAPEASLVPLVGVGLLGMKKGFQAMSSNPDGSDYTERAKRFGRSGLAIAGVLGVLNFGASIHDSFDSNGAGFEEVPTEQNADYRDDVKLGVLVDSKARSGVKNHDMFDVDLRVTEASAFEGKGLTAKYYMLSEDLEIPADGDKKFYDGLVFLGERSDLLIKNGSSEVTGFWEYDENLESPFLVGSAMIDPFEGGKYTKDGFRLLVELWDGDEKLARNWWGKINGNDAYVINFSKSEDPLEVIVKEDYKRVDSCGRKVFIYQQSFGNDLRPDIKAVVDVFHPHLYDITAKGNLKQRVSEGTVDRLVRNADRDGYSVLPMVSAFLPSTIRVVLNNPNSVAKKIAAEVKAEGYEGVAIDFESVRLGSKDSKKLVEFMRVLRKALPEGQYEIAIATSPRFDDTARGFGHHLFYDFAGIQENVDYLQIMNYDWDKGVGGPVLPESRLIQTVQYAQQHIPSDKLVVLTPGYGRVWRTNGSEVGTLSSRNNSKYLSGSKKTVDGELRVNTDTRIAYLQTPEVFERRFELFDTLGVGNVGIWRASQTSTGLTDTFADWKDQKLDYCIIE